MASSTTNIVKVIDRIDYSPNIILTCEYVLLEELTDTSYTVLDLTGATFLLMVRPSLKSQTVIVEASTANGKVVQAPVTTEINGTEVTENGIIITFTAADTLAIYNQTIGNFAVSDLQLTLAPDPPIDGVVCSEYYPCIFSTRDYSLRECCG